MMTLTLTREGKREEGCQRWRGPTAELHDAGVPTDAQGDQGDHTRAEYGSLKGYPEFRVQR